VVELLAGVGQQLLPPPPSTPLQDFEQPLQQDNTMHDCSNCCWLHWAAHTRGRAAAAAAAAAGWHFSLGCLPATFVRLIFLAGKS